MLWDNTTRFLFTLAGAIIGLIAVLLIPGRTRVEESRAETYSRTGKWLVFIFAFLILGLAGVLAWEWFLYKVQNLWVAGNLALFAFLGIILIAGNIWTMRYIKMHAGQVEIVEAEVVELSAEEGAQPGLIDEKAAAAPLPEPLPTPIEPLTGSGEAPKE